MTLPDLATLLPEIRAIAEAAGEVILDIYERPIAVREKEDASPVTDADQAAEAIILPALQALTPDIPVISEEDVAANGAPATAPQTFWLVDPLDGTREFIKKNGEFTVNIGLVHLGAPVLGVVLAPALGLGYGGIRAPDEETATFAGCWHGQGALTPIQTRRPRPAAAVVVASRSHGNEAALEAFMETLACTDVISAGSALKFGLLAAGEADLYPRFGRTMEWDTAAGHAVLLAAGGGMATLDGMPFRYGKAAFANPPFLAFGAGAGLETYFGKKADG